ncbi:hypothetical protein BC937DRAFT_95100 [Endogone sp. FLAS-F59071]|nr:hypothetical protein BC937DRAFT_95100 [Endogone sp. FLAS-F59071]|eukprot:RUS13580.1 hypothetical protein BC937DRAFT_95100 [Endogone sp. FLAS-F59071]
MFSDYNRLIFTLAYLTPTHQLSSPPPPKADIWSFGITIYEIATGNPPFAHHDPVRAIFLIPRERPAELKGSFSAEMKEFVACCLCEDPNERPTAEELLKHKWLKNNRAPQSMLKDLITQFEQWRRSADYRKRYNAEDPDVSDSDIIDSDEFPESVYDPWDFATIRSEYTTNFRQSPPTTTTDKTKSAGFADHLADPKKQTMPSLSSLNPFQRTIPLARLFVDIANQPATHQNSPYPSTPYPSTHSLAASPITLDPYSPVRSTHTLQPTRPFDEGGALTVVPRNRRPSDLSMVPPPGRTYSPPGSAKPKLHSPTVPRPPALEPVTSISTPVSMQQPQLSPSRGQFSKQVGLSPLNSKFPLESGDILDDALTRKAPPFHGHARPTHSSTVSFVPTPAPTVPSQKPISRRVNLTPSNSTPIKADQLSSSPDRQSSVARTQHAHDTPPSPPAPQPLDDDPTGSSEAKAGLTPEQWARRVRSALEPNKDDSLPLKALVVSKHQHIQSQQGMPTPNKSKSNLTLVFKQGTSDEQPLVPHSPSSRLAAASAPSTPRPFTTSPLHLPTPGGQSAGREIRPIRFEALRTPDDVFAELAPLVDDLVCWLEVLEGGLQAGLRAF